MLSSAQQHSDCSGDVVITKDMLARCRVVGQADRKYIMAMVDRQLICFDQLVLIFFDTVAIIILATFRERVLTRFYVVAYLSRHAVHERIRLEAFERAVYAQQRTRWTSEQDSLIDLDRSICPENEFDDDNGSNGGGKMRNCDKSVIDADKLSCKYTSWARRQFYVQRLVPASVVPISAHNSVLLADHTIYRAVACWGWQIDPKIISSDAGMSVAVRTVPVVLGKALLGKDVTSFLGALGRTIDEEGVKSVVPPAVKKLLARKACRGAIMFNDELTHTQCSKLMQQLATCALPFQCAHGRPTLAPLLKLPDLTATPKYGTIQ